MAFHQEAVHIFSAMHALPQLAHQPLGPNKKQFLFSTFGHEVQNFLLTSATSELLVCMHVVPAAANRRFKIHRTAKGRSYIKVLDHYWRTIKVVSSK
jgi:hypothetical protein